MWQKLNIEDARINMSKVVPYDSQLNLLDKKQAYFHNNRLTSLRKYTTDSAVGYKCYKRKANSSHLVDGELTDYIEINKVTEGGSVVHMLDVADSYYHYELTTAKQTESIVYDSGSVYINDYFVFNIFDHFSWEVKILSSGDVAVEFDSEGVVTIFTARSQFTKKIKTNISWDNIFFAYGHNDKTIRNIYYFDVSTVTIIDNQAKTNIISLPTTANNSYTVFPYYEENASGEITQKELNLSQVSNGKSHYIHQIVLNGIGDNDIEYGLSIVQCFMSWNNATQSYYGIYFGFMIWFSFDYFTDCDLFNSSHRTYESIADYEFNRGVYGYPGYNEIKPDYMDGDTYRRASIWSVYWLQGDNNFNNQKNGFVGHSVTRTGDKIFVDDIIYSGIASSETKTESIEISKTHFDTPYQINNNSSLILNNGFVLNSVQKNIVSIGHNYKVIARMDVQDSSFCGSDNENVYIKMKSNYYAISIKKMFPDVTYDSEVNIIESDFCKIVNGYKIFNTTTYWNAIYNDDPEKIICSCDDWNGRIKTSIVASNSNYRLATSRVGHFWDKTQSFYNIPCKSISDEQNDFFICDGTPIFEWSNSRYTIHPDVFAYIYYSNSDTVETKYQQIQISSNGINIDYDEQNIFTHNADYQLVPSILFSDFLKSDVVNVIQIGSEAYELLNYAYSPATPALVYSEIAISINVDPTSQEMVIQGAYYTIGGSSDNRKILNPYDTSASTYCCDVTGLRYLGYDSEQAYFYSPATGIIYTFNGANKLNAFLEVDKRIPLESGVIGSDKVGIVVTNIPSMNIIAMAFTDGVLIICNGQSVFIEAQNVNTMEASKEYGLIKINGSYYYFGINNTITGLIDDAQEVAVDFNIKSCKIGKSRLENVTCSKHRICIYSDVLDSTNKAEISVSLTGLLGNKTFSETLTKTITQRDLIDNEYQWEFNPKNTKMQYFQTEVTMKNADMLEYWMDINEQTEENLTRR